MKGEIKNVDDKINYTLHDNEYIYIYIYTCIPQLHFNIYFFFFFVRFVMLLFLNDTISQLFLI